MTSLAPTPEQQAIIDAALTGNNLVIQAGAGTGKTSTLEMTANNLRKHIELNQERTDQRFNALERANAWKSVLIAGLLAGNVATAVAATGHPFGWW